LYFKKTRDVGRGPKNVFRFASPARGKEEEEISKKYAFLMWRLMSKIFEVISLERNSK
jgi:hypothetical protein